LGVQPGISTWEEIRKVEGPLYFREKYIPDKSNSTFLYTYIEKRIDNFDVTLWGAGNTIEQITADARIYLPNEHSHREKFAQAMAAYSLPNILLEYGVPSRILLQVQGQAEPNSGTQTEILLFYNQLGIVVHYFFENTVTQDSKTGILRTCPNYEHISFIKFYLQNSRTDIPLERMIDDEKSYYLNSWLHPIEKITALNVVDFYNLFSNPNKTVCFDVP
jgi:hypothetical protein